jgi:molybdopterin molybdotransferase
VSLITLDEARTLLLSDLPALGTERVALDDCLGRTLAEAVIASHTQPAEARATMDGIAVTDVKPALGASWQLVGDAPAGATSVAPLRSGDAVRIATGGVVPEGATRVLPQELVRFADDEATLVSACGASRFIRRTGSDFQSGEPLLERGIRIGPAELGLIAAANCSSVHVLRQPRIAICTAGDELVPAGSALSFGQSVDSATHALAALIGLWGGAPKTATLLRDDLPAIVAALAALAEECDVVICVGGASVGSRDLMRPAATAIGAQFLFAGVAVQPGKPCWHARHKDAMLLGLPGNPSSAFVCAHLLLLPLIERLMNRPGEQELRTAYGTTNLPANGDREQYLRAAGSYDAEGRLLVTPVADQDSGLQANLAKAQFLLRRAAGAPSLDGGAKVEVLELTGV